MNSLEGLTPEQIQQLIKLGGLGEKQDLLKEQLAQANALRNPRKGYGFWGGLTNGLADVADKVISGIEARQAREQMGLTQAEIDRIRGLAGGALERPQEQRPERQTGYPEIMPNGSTRYTGGY